MRTEVVVIKKLVMSAAIIFFTSAAVYYYNCTRPVHVLAAGDMLLGRDVAVWLEKKGFDYPYGALGKEIRKADIAFANLECPLTDGGRPVLKRPDLVFRGSTENVKTLKKAGFDILNLANNHTMDQGREGLLETLSLLEEEGIMSLGAGSSRIEARMPVFMERGITRIGFLGYCDFPPEGYIYDEHGADVARPDLKSLRQEVESAGRQCDFLAVSFHWGKEFDSYPGELQRRLAHEAIDSGADIVIGHHPHVLQGVEQYKGKLIFYSLGNFVFDRQLHMWTDESVMLDIAVAGGECKSVRLIPVRIRECRPVIVVGEEAGEVLKRYDSLCDGLGIDIEIRGSTGHIVLR